MITLTNNNWDVVISPEHGASILKCQFKGYDILRPVPKDWLIHKAPFDSGCFPLVPFSNRIEKGQFEFSGYKVSLPQNHTEQAHVIHGVGWTSSWDVRVQERGHCELVLIHKAGDWPWSFEVTYQIFIAGSILKQSLSIQNIGDKPMPAGLGFHPYFPDRKSADVMFNSSGYWQAGEDMLPINWLATKDMSDFSSKKNLIGVSFDNCFTGWDGHAEISWRDKAHKLKIWGSKFFDHAVLYTPLHQSFFCFEPVSHANNILANKDVGSAVDTMTLKSRETKHGVMTIEII